MSSSWFVVPLIGSGTLDEPYEPAFADLVDGYGGYPDEEAGVFIVRFFGTSSILSSVALKSGAQELADQEVVSRLNDEFVEQQSIDEWNEKFSAGT